MTSLGPPLRVLVVEDDFLIADDIANALEKAGAVVVGPSANVRGALERMAEQDALEVAVLDISLGAELVFPVADELAHAAVPLVFFSGYDDIAIPERFTDAVVISKSRGVGEVVDAVLERQFHTVAGGDGDSDFGIVEILPELRILARRLKPDPTQADNLVERTLETALASLERGRWKETPRRYLRRLLREIHKRDERLYH